MRSKRDLDLSRADDISGKDVTTRGVASRQRAPKARHAMRRGASGRVSWWALAHFAERQATSVPWPPLVAAQRGDEGPYQSLEDPVHDY